MIAVPRVVVLALLLGGPGAWAWVPTADAADTWEIRRHQGTAQRQQVLRALLAAPEDPAVARALLAATPARDRTRLLDDVAARTRQQPPSYAALMAHGHLLQALGRPAPAADAFAQAARVRDERAAAHWALARALEADQRPDRALEAYQAAATREPSPARRAQILTGAAAVAAGLDPARELDLRQRLYATAPGDGSALALGQALARAGRAAEGGRLLEHRSARAGTTVARRRLLVQAAELHERGGDDEAAERTWLAALERTAGDGAAALAIARRLAALAVRRGEAGATAMALESRLSRGGPAQRQAWGPAVAELHEAAGDHEAALALWQQLGPGARNQAAILRLLDRLGRQDELDRRFDHLARDRSSLDLLLPVIERSFEQGDRPRANARFDRLRKALRRDRASLLRLADLASRFEEHDRVLASWDALFALDPRDEQAIIGLGEAQLARGRRELARRTWGALLRRRGPAAQSHARLADLLSDHDMLDEAVVQAQAARRLQPGEPSHNRTLARILEKRREPTAAIAAWRAVLQASGGPDHEPARREARGRILNLLAREGRERLRAETVLLKDRARRHPEDRETALYLAELQLRLQEPAAAVETLTATAERVPGDAEVVLMLVRLLRQSRQTEKALGWLDRLADSVPTRAAEALLQVAALRLDRYEDDQAFAAAERAVQLADGSSEVVLRAAEVAERAGRTEAARRFLSRSPGEARVALAAARLEVRQGDHRRALDLLLRAATDIDPGGRSDLLAEALRIGEAAGQTSAALARFPRPKVGPLEAPLEEDERTLIVQLARGGRSVSPVLAGMASEAILQALDDPRRTPAPQDVQLLGELGNHDAVPRLLRLVARGNPGLGGGARTVPGDHRAAVAAALALGRLADPRGRITLEGLTQDPNVRLREAATWALGQLADPRSAPALLRASEDPRAEVRVWALLGLGRLSDVPEAPIERAALDASAPIDVRRAAVLAAVAASARTSTSTTADRWAGTLAPLVRASDPALAACAAVALGALGSQQALPALWRLALLADLPARRHGLRALADLAASDGRPTDATARPATAENPAQKATATATATQAQTAEAGTELRAGPVLDRMCAGPAAGDIGTEALGSNPPTEKLEQLWVEHAQELGVLLAEALGGGASERRRALVAVSGARDTLFGHSLAPSARRTEALATLRQHIDGPLGRALADPDWTLRIHALQAAAFLQDRRYAEAHVVALIAQLHPDRSAQTRADAQAAAIAAINGLRAQGRLDAGLLMTGLRPLLRQPAWQTRLAALRIMLHVAELPADVRAAALADPSPFVRAAAAASGPRATPTQAPQ